MFCVIISSFLHTLFVPITLVQVDLIYLPKIFCFQNLFQNLFGDFWQTLVILFLRHASCDKSSLFILVKIDLCL